MSKRELGRVEVLARVRSGELRVVDAAGLLRGSYRQAKRLWERDQEEGAGGLKHRNAGRGADRGDAGGVRHKVLGRGRGKDGGAGGGGFWPDAGSGGLG